MSGDRPPRRVAAVVVLAALALAAAACDLTAGPSAPPSPVATVGGGPAATGGGTFRYGIGDPTAIVPHLVQTPDDRAVVDALYDSLTAWDPAGRPVPAAATSWTSSADATLWTVHLRPGATFHDGRPVTAEDFRRGWDRLVDDGPAGYLLEDVGGYAALRRGELPSLTGVQVTADDELRITLTRPRADLPEVLGHPALGPLHPDDVRDAGTADPVRQPTGNGPFALTEPWAPGEFIRAERWDPWTNGDRAPLGISEVVFRIADLDINYLAFTQGRRDFTAVPTDALPVAAADYPGRAGSWDGPGLITGGTPAVYVLGMNRAVAPYDQRAVREAVSLVVDRARLAAEGEGGNLAPSTSLLPPSLPGARLETCDLCTFNPSGALDRLEGAGVDQLSLWFNGGGGHERVRDVLRSALSDIGVALVSNGRGPAPDLPTYQALLATGRPGLFRLPLVADVPSALSVLEPLLHSARVPEAGGLNAMRYADPQVDALLEQAARTTDPLAREALLRRVEDIAVNRDVVVVPVFSYQHAHVASESVRGLRYGPFGLLDLTEVVLTR
jgi:ABC-type transport system substrate-binding protein